MIKAPCLTCQNEIVFASEPVVGESVTCPACQTDQEVVWLYPLCLDFGDKSRKSSYTQPRRRTRGTRLTPSSER